MMKKILNLCLISSFSLVVLVYYNYQLAQKRLREERPTRFAIEWVKWPDELKANQPANFSWKVDASDTSSAVKTGIYYSYDSSPSALTKFDSPAAVGYPNFTFDYATGLFSLPDTFDLNLSLSKKGPVFMRAYALIGQDHLWTEEKRIIVK